MHSYTVQYKYKLSSNDSFLCYQLTYMIWTLESEIGSWLRSHRTVNMYTCNYNYTRETYSKGMELYTWYSQISALRASSTICIQNKVRYSELIKSFVTKHNRVAIIKCHNHNLVKENLLIINYCLLVSSTMYIYCSCCSCTQETCID